MRQTRKISLKRPNTTEIPTKGTPKLTIKPKIQGNKITKSEISPSNKKQPPKSSISSNLLGLTPTLSSARVPKMRSGGLRRKKEGGDEGKRINMRKHKGDDVGKGKEIEEVKIIEEDVQPLPGQQGNIINSKIQSKCNTIIVKEMNTKEEGKPQIVNILESGDKHSIIENIDSIDNKSSIAKEEKHPPLNTQCTFFPLSLSPQNLHSSTNAHNMADSKFKFPDVDPEVEDNGSVEWSVNLTPSPKLANTPNSLDIKNTMGDPQNIFKDNSQRKGNQLGPELTFGAPVAVLGSRNPQNDNSEGIISECLLGRENSAKLIADSIATDLISVSSTGGEEDPIPDQEENSSGAHLHQIPHSTLISPPDSHNIISKQQSTFGPILEPATPLPLSQFAPSLRSNNPFHSLPQKPLQTLLRQDTMDDKWVAKRERKMNAFEEEKKKIEKELQDREDRIKNQLGTISKKMRVIDANEQNLIKTRRKSEVVELSEKIGDYDSRMNNYLDKIQNIYELTKQTQKDVEKSQDILCGIQNSGNDSAFGRNVLSMGSFHGQFIDDDEIFNDNLYQTEPLEKSSQAAALKHTQDGELSQYSNILPEKMLTTDDLFGGISGTELVEELSEMKNKLIFYEEKILQSETKRLESENRMIQKEKENTNLKGLIMELEDRIRKVTWVMETAKIKKSGNKLCRIL